MRSARGREFGGRCQFLGPCPLKCVVCAGNKNELHSDTIVHVRLTSEQIRALNAVSGEGVSVHEGVSVLIYQCVPLVSTG